MDLNQANAEQLSAENSRLRALVAALEKLLACYRVGKRPSEKLLDEIGRLKGE